ncbi:S8 family serine peptidase [Virgibacillus sp. MSJ-26]|uniref:S8 family peptidase n=1 Tax=Virgibacillus sp. MSJ-26 TaxID=2841522 RepID=UPI001C11A8A9|nr:S8 family serine peptidase [Virgibacillus sp. MSJ-26]MBU5465933.1 S8 family serine peptidase [Virgibacillus sp. MSJ-26]
MKCQPLIKKSSIIVLSLSLIVFTLLTSVIIQSPTSNALEKNTPTGEQHQELGSDEEGKHVVTLITGDIVTVTEMEDGEEIISVEPSTESNEGTRMTTVGEDTYVIPNEAMPYLAAGVLDRELFNITSLIEYGYDDSERHTVPLIIQHSQKTKAQILTSMPELANAEEVSVLESIDSVALSENKKNAGNIWEAITKDSNNEKVKANDNHSEVAFNNGIEKIWLDGQVEATLAESVPQIGAPEAWESGYSGEGATVAVLDTGIDNEHPDIEGQLIDMESFVPGDDGLDRHGHGTHVASTVLGTGAASDGNYKGVATGAKLLSGKVLGDDGFGQDSWIISAMEWAAQNADIVNMSLGSNYPTDGTDPMSQALNEISAETDTLFVVAAGNAGQVESVGSPGAADSALTVGNVDKSDQLAVLSSMGPRVGDMAIKPDLVAPGEEIIAARSQFASGGTGDYMGMSGTSMASPHVAGAAAIIKQKYPDWTNTQIKNAMMSTTKQLDEYQAYQVGTGRVDIPSTLDSDIYATGSLSFGFFKWPHDDNDPVEKTVTYHNNGDEDVTLDLTAIFTDENGDPAPSDMLELSDTSVTVPVNGNAEISVTLDPKFGDEGTRYWGQLNAELNGETVAHTAMGMVKEDEKYPLTLNVTDRDGSPGSAYVEIIGTGLENPNPEYVTVEGTAEVRLPKGTYSAMSLMDVNVDTEQEGIALVGNPEIHLDSSVTVDMDAQEANEITVDVPKKTESSYQRVEYYRQVGGMETNSIYMLPAYMDKVYATPIEQVEEGEFEMVNRWRLIKPFLTVNSDEYEYDVTPLPGMTLFNGEYHLDTVYAGNGTPEDYKQTEAKGKAVVVTRNENISAAAQATAALEAGAELLIIANNESTKFSEFVGNDDNSDIPLTVVSVSGVEGDKLIKSIEQGNVVLDGEATPDTPYLYDLVDAHTDEIPEDLSYSPTPEELVKINSKYISNGHGAGAEFRFDSREYSLRSWGEPALLSLPSVREEWVSATEGTEWYQEASELENSSPYTLDDSWQIRGTGVTYEPGERLEEDWFVPVIQPRFGDGYWTPFREIQGGFQFNVPAFADSGFGRTGGLSNWEQQQQFQKLKVYQGDTLLEEMDGQTLIIWDELPEERLEYRLVSETKHNEKYWDTSSETHTEWTFWSEGGHQSNVDLPLLSLNYKTDVNMAGHLVANRSTDLTIDVTQLEGVSGYGEIEDTSLKVSYDEGQTWEKVDLVQEDGWLAEIKPPKDAKSISLQASASDDEGNEISQEIIEAYKLTKSGAADMQPLLEDLEEKGDAKSEATRTLNMHLTTLKLFEEKGEAEKVIKHLNGLNQLLDHYENEGLLSGRAYNLLKSDAIYLNETWE